MGKLNRKFYSRNTKTVAKNLLGKVLVLGKCKGKIVETEAYLGLNDPGAIGFRKVKNIPKSLLKPPGYAFVYFTYGNHWMLNVVTEKEGVPGAVLIRALEPLEGVEFMKRRRGIKDIRNLADGPGKLTKAFGIDKRHNGLDMIRDELFIEDSKEKPKICTTTRIGINKGKGMPLRFYIKDSDFVSKREPLP